MLISYPDSPDSSHRECPFRRRVKAAPYAMFMVDGLRRMLLVNHKAEDIFGYDPGETRFLPISIGAVVQEALRLITHSVSVRTALTEPLPGILGDQVQFQQVLMNLISNAIDAMAARHGKLWTERNRCAGTTFHIEPDATASPA